jgi:DnaJ-class molecular chaperone
MFSNIKYNLYEILNVPQNSDDKTIKKQYLKLIKKFHPDKNNKIEEEIYFHILYANQILLDNDLRMKYDEFIKETTRCGWSFCLFRHL